MGAKSSKGTFNRQAKARQSQKKSYQKFRQSIAKLTKNVNKVKIENKGKLLELEIAIKSAANDIEIAKKYTEPGFEEIFEDFLKKCEELDKVVKDKLEQNDRSLEDSQQKNEGSQNPQNSDFIETPQQACITTVEDNGAFNIETVLFAEDFTKPDVKEKKKKKVFWKSDNAEGNKQKQNKNETDILEVNSILSEEEDRTDNEHVIESKKDKKKDKNNKSKSVTKEADDNTSRDTLDIDEIDKGSTITSKKRFWSLPIRLKRKASAATSTPEPIILIQDPENEDRSLQNIEIHQLEKAIKNNNKKDKTKRQSRVLSQFFDQQSTVPPTPSSTPVPSPKSEPPVQQQDAMQEIHNIRMSISTLEEMTKIYRLANRGNYDYIYDNLSLCVSKLKDMDQEQNVGLLTLRHEKKLAMQHAQECLDVLEGKAAVPERVDGRTSQLDDHRASGGAPQVVIARTPSKKRDNCQKSVEFIDITNNDEVINIPLENKTLHNNEDIVGIVPNIGKDMERFARYSTDEFSEDDDLKDILMSLQDSTEEINNEKVASTKPILITSF